VGVADHNKQDQSFESEFGGLAQYRNGFADFPQGQIIEVSKRIRDGIYSDVKQFYLLNRLAREPYDHQVHRFFDKTRKTIHDRLADLLQEPAVQNMAHHKGKYPFVILRNALRVPGLFPGDDREILRLNAAYHKKIKSRQQDLVRRIDTILGGILDLFDARPINQYQPKRPDEHPTFGADLITRWDYQENCDNFLPDLPLRFHQRTVHRSLPADRRNTSMAHYIAFGTVRNIRRIPILALTVDDIIRTIREGSPDGTADVIDRKANAENTIAALCGSHFLKSIPRMVLERVANNEADYDRARPILGKLGDEWIMSFDPAHVWPERAGKSHGEAMDAIYDLRTALEVASLDKTKVYRIVLKRHDVLIVDNLRATLSRSEDTPSRFDWGMFSYLHKRRWLRMMLGAKGAAH
jgi:hypothetical protein